MNFIVFDTYVYLFILLYRFIQAFILETLIKKLFEIEELSLLF